VKPKNKKKIILITMKGFKTAALPTNPNHPPPPTHPNQILQNPKSVHNPPPSYPDPDQSNPKKNHPIYFKIIHLPLVLPNDSLAQVSRSTLCTYFLCVVLNTSHDDKAVLIRRTAEGLLALAN
jgi:hypothetical protein